MVFVTSHLLETPGACFVDRVREDHCHRKKKGGGLVTKVTPPYLLRSGVEPVVSLRKQRTETININNFTRDICYPFQKLWNEYCSSDLNSLKDHSSVLFETNELNTNSKAMERKKFIWSLLPGFQPFGWKVRIVIYILLYAIIIQIMMLSWASTVQFNHSKTDSTYKI